VAAGLFVRTIQNLHNVNTGFDTERLLAFDLAPEMAGYPASGVVPVEQRALDSIASLPGVRGVGATNDPDLSGNDRAGDVQVSGYTAKPDEDFDVELPWVSDGYLQTLGVRCSPAATSAHPILPAAKGGHRQREFRAPLFWQYWRGDRPSRKPSRSARDRRNNCG